MNQTDKASITKLCQAAEQKAGRVMRTPKDFDYLRDCIYEQCHNLVSVSTLKRIWGYNKYENTPRDSSLDPIAQFIGYSNWEKFLQSISNETTEEPTAHSQDNNKFRRSWAISAMCTLVFVMGIGIWIWLSHHKTMEKAGTTQKTIAVSSGKRVLRKGQDCFRSIEEYLPLFGVESSDTAYFQPVPHLQEVYVWGPEFHHPVWHNDGDANQLMPTITEYWTPLFGEKNYQTPEYIRLANEKLYYERLDKDELRITFMKNIVDNFYVFLGIYRMDKEHSTTEKTVWKRIADQCDIGNLAQIEQMRKDNL